MVHAAICRYVRTEHRKPPVGRYVCSEKRQFETRTTHMGNDVMSDIIGSKAVGVAPAVNARSGCRQIRVAAPAAQSGCTGA